MYMKSYITKKEETKMYRLRIESFFEFHILE